MHPPSREEDPPSSLTVGAPGGDGGRRRSEVRAAAPPLDPGVVCARASDDSRVAPLAADLRRRLRAVCRDWDDAEFEAMVQQIARRKARWSEAELGD